MLTPFSPDTPSAVESTLEQSRDDLLEHLNSEWQNGRLPVLDDHLPEDLAGQPELLADILDGDLEYRIKAGETIGVETYLKRYAALASREDLVYRLLKSEFKFRTRTSTLPFLSEFGSRFPQFFDKLRAEVVELARAEPTDGLGVCQQCHEVHFIAPKAVLPAKCTVCGGSFNQENGVRVSHRHFGKFELLELAGRGGFGTVYRARDTSLNRIVAIKIPHQRFSESSSVDRFRREALSSAQLTHPGIVPIYEVGEVGDIPYIASEYIQGVTLSEFLKRRRDSGKPLSFEECARIVQQIAAALYHVHQAGVIHRDLKPANVMIANDGTPRIMDFGLAKLELAEGVATMTSDKLGSPAYMSPELARGDAKKADARSDIFSLGVILYEMLSGEHPFRGARADDVMRQICDDQTEPRRLRFLDQRIPVDLETISLAAMAKNPLERYQTAREVSEELSRYLAGQNIARRPPTRLESAWKWCRRHRFVAGSAAAIAASLLAGTIVSLSFAAMAKAEGLRADQKAVEATGNAALAEQRQNLVFESLAGSISAVNEAIENRPELHQVGTGLLTKSLDQLATLRHSTQAKGETDRLIAVAAIAVADGLTKAGKGPEARRAYAQAITSLEELTQSDPDNKRALLDLASANRKLGTLNAHSEEFATAKENISTSLAIYNRVFKTSPEDGEVLLGIVTNLCDLGALCASKGDIAGCRRILNEASAYCDLSDLHPRKLLVLADFELEAAQLELTQNKTDDANEHFLHVIKLAEQYLASDSQSAKARSQIAQANAFLAVAKATPENFAEIEPMFEAAIASAKKATHLAPGDYSTWEVLASCYMQYSASVNVTGAWRKGFKFEREFAEAARQVQSSDPRRITAAYRSAKLFATTAAWLRERHYKSNAEAMLSESIRACEDALALGNESGIADYDSYRLLADSCLTMGMVEGGDKVRMLSRAIECYKTMVGLRPSNSYAFQRLLEARRVVGTSLFESRQYEGALEQFEQLIPALEPLATRADAHLSAMSDLSRVYEMIALIHLDQISTNPIAHLGLGLEASQKSHALVTKVVKLAPELTTERIRFIECSTTLGRFLRSKGDHKAARACVLEAMAELDLLAKDGIAPALLALPGISTLSLLGDLQADDSDYAAASGSINEAVELCLLSQRPYESENSRNVCVNCLEKLISVATQAKKSDPGSADARANLFKAYRRAAIAWQFWEMSLKPGDQLPKSTEYFRAALELLKVPAASGFTTKEAEQETESLSTAMRPSEHRLVMWLALGDLATLLQQPVGDLPKMLVIRQRDQDTERVAEDLRLRWPQSPQTLAVAAECYALCASSMVEQQPGLSEGSSLMNRPATSIPGVTSKKEDSNADAIVASRSFGVADVLSPTKEIAVRDRDKFQRYLDLAVSCLREAIANDYQDVAKLLEKREFTVLRGHPGFMKLRKTVGSK